MYLSYFVLHNLSHVRTNKSRVAKLKTNATCVFNKKHQTVQEWGNYEKSNNQILPAKIWKTYPDRTFQSFDNRYLTTSKTNACK